jgi:glycosyltransferase involved in cell wall biosynthesis
MLNLIVGGKATQGAPVDEVVPVVADECKDGSCKVEISPKVRAEIEGMAMELFKKGDPAVGEGQTEQVVSEAVKKPVIERDTWPDQSTDDPKVTLAMIVRDEEAHIAECLESMKGYVDEIVVVDTGSKDKTIEICKSFGAKVYEHPWEDSFALARNQVIGHVETPWLIQMDADEIMEKKDAERVRDVVRSAHKNTTNLIHLVLINKEKGAESNTSVINSGKIMRVTPELHFTSRVHNKLHCPGDSILTNLTIFHHGYALPDEETMRKKKDRTTRLLLMQSEEQPEDCETHHYLAIQYLRGEEWDKAIEMGQRAVSLFEKHEPHSQLQLLSIYVIAISYYHKAAMQKTRDTQNPLFNEAIRWCKHALTIYPDYLDCNNLLGSIYFALKDHANCWTYSEKYLQICDMHKKDPSKAMVIPLMTLRHEWMTCLQLAINFFEQAKADEAIHFIAKGEDLLPKELKYKVSWGVFKYMITLGDSISLKNAEAIYMTGFRP